MFKAFCTRKEGKLRGGQTIHFRFYLSKLKSYFPILSAQCVGSGGTNSHVFFGENKMLGSQSAAIELRVWRNIGMHIVPTPCGY